MDYLFKYSRLILLLELGGIKAYWSIFGYASGFETLVSRSVQENQNFSGL